jgi:hypothetical protein
MTLTIDRKMVVAMAPNVHDFNDALCSLKIKRNCLKGNSSSKIERRRKCHTWLWLTVATSYGGLTICHSIESFFNSNDLRSAKSIGSTTFILTLE